MAKTVRNGKARKPVSSAGAQRGPNWPVFVLALIGMALTSYLTYAAWQRTLVAGCTPGSACDVVLNSRWSRLFGMPVSFWGLLTYGALAAVAWNRQTADQWKIAWTISLAGLVYSIYLTTVAFFVLDAACPYCLTSLGLMAAIFGVVLYQRPADLPAFSWGPWIAKTGGAGLALTLVLHLFQAGYLGKAPAPEDPWIRGLADHLRRTNAKFYGAYWCPHCQEQKAAFGSSADRLPYIECSPAGRRGPVATACVQAGIESYPTWIINGQRYLGTLSLDNLARYSQYSYSAADSGAKP
ncbi:MAG TPA: vitamin K epoxide reductase family protein [candidate division Zixibacteria bacterium]|nr:vitamin K epoxide reductase family protein [candidate division Zixibacteria bacterium]